MLRHRLPVRIDLGLLARSYQAGFSFPEHGTPAAPALLMR
jgi:hypothetical protein